MSVAERLASDVHSLEQQAHGTVAAAAAWAEEVHLTLHGIRHNTSQLFFWTAFLGAVGATTALLYALNRLRDQLEQLNRHQVTYRDMWARERDRLQSEARQETGVRRDLLERMTADWDEVEHAKFGLMRDMAARAGQSEALLEELVAGGARPPRPVHRRRYGGGGGSSSRSSSSGYADHEALLDHLAREREGLPSPPRPSAARAAASGYLGAQGRGGTDRALGSLDRGPGPGLRSAHGSMAAAALGGRSPSHSFESVDSDEQELIEELAM